MTTERSDAPATQNRSASRPSWFVTVIWALSPTALLTAWVAIYGVGPSLSWMGFLGGVMNLYVFSANQLLTRDVEDWYVKAVPLTLALLLVNAGLFLGATCLLGLIPAGGLQP